MIGWNRWQLSDSNDACHILFVLIKREVTAHIHEIDIISDTRNTIEKHQKLIKTETNNNQKPIKSIARIIYSTTCVQFKFLRIYSGLGSQAGTSM